MTTKCIVIGKTPKQNKSKSIQFEKVLLSDFTISEDTAGSPHNFNYIELICINYAKNKDLMFAYNNPEKRSEGTLYIGKWNDGVIE